MKKIYLLVGATAFLGSAFSQSGNMNVEYPAVETTKHGSVDGLTQKIKPAQQFEAKGITIWEDDFSDPSEWMMTNTSAPTPEDWTIETDPSNMPNAAAELYPFASTTANNGFALINSDGQPGNVDGDGAIVAEITTVNAIDLSLYPYVTLSFEHNYRWWQEKRAVRVSGDNGANWTEFELTNGAGSPPNQNSGNPEVTSIDISAVAGGQNQVLVQFYYNDNDYWGWYWAVDDVKITETDPYDLRNNGIYWGSMGPIGARIPYYQVPLDQIAPVDLSGSVANVGYEDQTDVEYSVSVVSEAFTSVSAAETVLAFSTDTVDCATQFTPPGLGSYTFDAAVTSGNLDATPTNNAITAGGVQEVTNYVYARDMGTSDGRFAPDMDYEAGNLFDVWVADDVTAIDVEFGTDLDINGLEVFGRIYSIDATSGDFVLVDETPIYNTASGWEGTVQTLAFSSPVPLNAGEAYLAVVGSFSTGMTVGTSGDSEDQTSFLYGDLGTAGIAWYFTNSTPMVRMNFDPTISVEANEMNDFNLNVYPNPAQNNANVDFTLENAGEVTFELTDLSGKTVYSTSEKMAAGNNSIVVPTDALSNGIYTFSFTNGNSVITKKLVVTK